MEYFPLFQPGVYFCDAANRGYLNLAIGETQYGMSPLAQKALIQSTAKCSWYPDSSAKRLIEKIAAHYQIDPDMVFIGNGVDEALLSCALAFLKPQALCLVSRSTFAGFEASAKLVHATLLYSPLRKMRVDVEDLATQIQKKPALWFLCNPHNPTGTVLSREELLYLFDLALEHQVVVAVDEAYAEFANPDQFTSAVSFLNRYPNLIAMRTFSKAYGLAGLRCGYAMGNKTVIQQLQKTRHVVPFNVNRLAIEVGCAAIEDQSFIAECYRKTEEVKTFFCSQLEEMGYFYIPSLTNMVFVQIDQEADRVCAELEHRYQILVRSGSSFGLPYFMRVTIGTMKQMQYVIECLKEVLHPILGNMQ